MNQNQDELDIIKNAQAGCKVAQETLIDRYGPGLLHFLSSRIARPQDAEDILHDTFVKVLSNLKSYKPQYRFSTWLYTIAIRQCYNFYRQEKQTMALSDITACCHDDPVQLLIRQETHSHLWQMAHKLLSINQFTAFELRYTKDLSIQKIAEVMHKTPMHVKVLLFRARSRLANYLSKTTLSDLEKESQHSMSAHLVTERSGV